MSFDFSGVKTNLEGINKYLESNGTKLTDNESKQLVSIFKEVDKNGNNVIDLDEQQLFKNLVEQKLNTLKDKINTFFSGIGNAIIGNKTLVAEPDATRVDNTEQKASVEGTSLNTSNSIDKLHKKEDAISHEKCVKVIANSWAKTYGVSNKDGEFEEFVEKVYQVAKDLNITKPNEKRDPKYPTIEDQVVDELMGAFANESKFKTTARSRDGLYHGIFQFSTIGMKELSQKKSRLKSLSMPEFEKLSRIQQLEYMLESVKISKKYYSKLGNEPISAKQVYAMWKFPAAGNSSIKIKYQRKIYTGNDVQKEKSDTIKSKMKERGDISFN